MGGADGSVWCRAERPAYRGTKAVRQAYRLATIPLRFHGLAELDVEVPREADGIGRQVFFLS